MNLRRVDGHIRSIAQPYFRARIESAHRVGLVADLVDRVRIAGIYSVGDLPSKASSAGRAAMTSDGSLSVWDPIVSVVPDRPASKRFIDGARPIATLWRWPPESCPGLWPRCSSSSRIEAA